MISFFRKALSSWVLLGLLALIMVAFVVTGVGTPSSLGDLGGTGSAVLKVGGLSVSEDEVRKRMATQLDAARQQQPDLDMASFVASGGLDQTLDQIINGRVVEAFAADQGMVMSKRAVDGMIASIPAFNGPTGQFDRNTFLAVLNQRKLNETQLRADFAREGLTRMLLAPAAGGALAPQLVALPYTSVLLESRQGLVGAVPSAAFAGAKPDDAAVKAYYTAHLARYSLPEQRTLRYAVVRRDQFVGKVQPTEADIKAYYDAHASEYAAKETRSFTQVIADTAEKAAAVEAKVRSGMSMDAAAKASGLAALTVAATDKASFGQLTSPELATAAFGAAKGALVPIGRTGLGFHLVRVDNITGTPARPLAQVHGQIAAQLGDKAVNDALRALAAKIDDATASGATFDEVVKDQKLSASTTPPITANGLSLEQNAYRPPAEVTAILKDAFQVVADDAPAITQLEGGKAFAFWHVDKITAAAPRPLNSIAALVAADAQADAASKAARRVADAIVAKVSKGMPMAKAIAEAGVALPAPVPAGGRRYDVMKQGDKVPPPVQALFALRPGGAKVIPAPNITGWFVVAVTAITPSKEGVPPQLVQATGQQLSNSMAQEYVEQFLNAIRKRVGVKRNDSAIAAIRASLSSAGAAGGQ